LLSVRAVEKAFPYNTFHPLNSLAAGITATWPEIVIACDDRSVQHLHALHDQAARKGPVGKKVAALIERSLGCPESYAIVESRYDLLRLAANEGLRVPRTMRIEKLEDLKWWCKHVRQLGLKRPRSRGKAVGARSFPPKRSKVA